MITLNINWSLLVENLRKYYKTLARCMHETGISYQTLERLYIGTTKQPRFDTGIYLLNLHLDKCGLEKHKEILL